MCAGSGPHFAPLPNTLLHPGSNQLMVRAALPPPGPSMNMPRLGIGPEAELRPLYDRRFFWLSVTPYITAVICLLVAAFVLFIWWRRRSEVVYGLFGLAAGLWGIRTLTFVIEVVPMQWWLLWRGTYLGATGGFIVAMAVLAMRYAGMYKPRVERALIAYWLVGPLWLLLGGVPSETLVNRYWIAGFVPIGMAHRGPFAEDDVAPAHAEIGRHARGDGARRAHRLERLCRQLERGRHRLRFCRAGPAIASSCCTTAPTWC